MKVLEMDSPRVRSTFLASHITILTAISCFLLLLVQVPQIGTAYSQNLPHQTYPQDDERILLLERETNHLKELESHHLTEQQGATSRTGKSSPHDESGHFERRSAGATLNGEKTQVAISLERVKNPDDADGYKNKKKKKFPVVWLRNQYPFNKYYKKKYNKQSNKYPDGDLAGQYSSESVEVLDPNPSTWVKIPDHPTASIKFQKQSSPFNFNQNLPPPASLIPSSHYARLVHNPLVDYQQQAGSHLSHLHHHRPHHYYSLGPPVISPGLMESESQQSDHSLPSGAAGSAGGAAGAAAASSKGGGDNGYGGISLSFGNGRSISFGGGQGLTIGGRAGAISIGGNKGGSGDNQQAASGYSSAETPAGKQAGAYKAYPDGSTASGSSMDSPSSGTNNAYGDKSYVNKQPTMSMDFPRRGKKIVHANLDGPPVKIRLHSSPRVKITTGSRDPLEKPGDDELTEEEEDIFEPPVPFEKKNSTMEDTNSTSTTDIANANGTTLSTGTNGTSEGLLTKINPMLLTNDFTEYSSKGQQYSQYQNTPYFSQQQEQFERPFDEQQPPSNYELVNRPGQIQRPIGDPAGQFRQPIYEIQQEYVPNASSGNVAHAGNPYETQRQFARGPPAPSHPQQPPFGQLQQQPYGANQVRQPISVQPAMRLAYPPVNPASIGHTHRLPYFVAATQGFVRQPLAEQVQRRPMSMAREQQPVLAPTEQVVPSQPMQTGQPMQPMQPMQALLGSKSDDIRPAVNQWRQFSQDARQQVVRTAQPLNQQLPKHVDPNPRFYNGSPNNGALQPNSIVEQPVVGNLPSEGKEVVEMSASSGHYVQLPGGRQQQQPLVSPGAQLAPHQGMQRMPLRPGSIQHPQFGPATAYQVAQAEPAREYPQQATIQQQQQQPMQQQAPFQQNIAQMPPNYRPVRVQKAPFHSEKMSEQQMADGGAARQAINKVSPATKVTAQVQQQAQESSNYQHASYPADRGGRSAGGGYGGGASSYAEDGTRTYTFGNGGISSSYGSGAGSGEYDSANAGGGGSRVSDGFDQKSYQAKVEKFEADAHDKRERSKVVLFLRPRISIHQANSSTTTKRPKNQQRFINVINKPIFLNTTNNMTHHEDEDFIDPDLKEPMELEGSAYGYGYGYGHGYAKQRTTSSSTTKKPKVKKPKSTTTSTTPSPESTTTELPSTTTTSPSTSSSDTTTSEPSSTEASSTTSDSSSSSSSSSTSSSSEEASEQPTGSSESPPSTPSSPSSSGTTSGSSNEEESSTTPVSVTERTQEEGDTEREKDTSSSPASSTSSSMGVATSSEGPEVETFSPTSASDSSDTPPSDEPADLVAAATTESSAQTPQAGSSAAPSTALPRTTRTSSASPDKSSAPSASALVSGPASKPELSTSSVASLSSPSPSAIMSSSSPLTASTLSLSVSVSTSGSSNLVKDVSSSPAGTSPSPNRAISSTELVTTSTLSPTEATTVSSSTLPTAAASSTSPDDSDTIVEQQNPSKRSPSVAVPPPRAMKGSPSSSAARYQQQVAGAGAGSQPMLLNPELIDRLMSNKTLVNLMSSQLKRVVDSLDLSSEREKRHIVRQVFEQMMEDKVDFSMNNVRLAVKTVSSSYKATAEKQRRQRTTTSAHLLDTQTSSSAMRAGTRQLDTELFGRRAVSAAGSGQVATELAAASSPVEGDHHHHHHHQQQQQQQLPTSRVGSDRIAKSAAATALTLTRVPSNSSSQSSKPTQTTTAARQRTGKSASSPSGDPIVVVLVPQEKA